jgi:hypothetical protein
MKWLKKKPPVGLGEYTTEELLLELLEREHEK